MFYLLIYDAFVKSQTPSIPASSSDMEDGNFTLEAELQRGELRKEAEYPLHSVFISKRRERLMDVGEEG